MLAISLSENFVRYGQLIKNDDSFSIEVMSKKPLPFKFEPAILKSPDFAAKLETIFLDIRSVLPVPDRFVALSVPSSWFSLSVNPIDLGLEPDKVAEILDWNEKQRLGEHFDQKFIQHYPLKQREYESKRDYLTVSYYKELGRVLNRACQPAGFNIKVFDLNIFSVATALERLYKGKNGEKWGVWRVDEDRHTLIIIKSDEFNQYIEFKLGDHSDYSILVNSNPGEDGEKVVSQINDLRNFSSEVIDSVDNLYFFAHDIDSEFYNMVLSYDISNLKCIDPFDNIKPVDLYKDDGEGTGAVSQFLDVLGLLFRFLPEGE
ncbi:MAG: hypothetical protein V1681_06610 [Candidatus Neomarinimicrobiota bacterium]